MWYRRARAVSLSRSGRWAESGVEWRVTAKGAPFWQAQLSDRVEWRTPDTYDPDFAPLPKESGVYVVVAIDLRCCDEGQCFVAYVGMSNNLRLRIKRSHRAIAEVERLGYFAKRYFAIIPASDLRDYERRIIAALRPTLNVVGKQKALQ